jgi:L-ascorbate metabolism protein UlaG (beta-lactamase superfamily)
MKITKLGHCCLLIEHKGKKIMTDPGAWSDAQNIVLGVDAILITHEHADHLHIESLETILHNNPNAHIITNSSVKKLLDEKNIPCEIVEDTQSTLFHEITIEGFGSTHEEIYDQLGQVQNTGYFIDNKLFYPGDAFTNPQKTVDILALPIVAPWTTFKTALDYALEIKPRIAFPVHDGMLIDGRFGPIYRLPPVIFENTGINFIPLQNGENFEG